jgi:4-hydroxy-tetrahydrodipicolinate reductase
MTIRIAVAGVTGRMGREVVAAAAGEPEVVVVGGTVRPGSAAAGQSWATVTGVPLPAARIATEPREFLAAADVVIDFTTPAAAVEHARACAETGVALVSGTTGLVAEQLAELRMAAERVPVFYARNMSLGVSALMAALPALVRALAGYDVEIVETHHRHKADAPSGTALALAEAVAGASGTGLEERASFGRRGVAPRRAGEIGIHAVRAGGNPGEHVVIVADDGEEIRIAHRAFGRRAYARGALRAAAFVAGRAPGFYGTVDLAAGAG